MSYRHPKQNYRCGLSSIGQPCEHGPDHSRCGKASACGNRTSDSTTTSPDLCRPIRTLVWWKRTFSILASVTTATVLGLLLFTPRPTNLVAPGGLSSHHAQILAKHGLNDSQRCAACHPNSKSGDESMHLSQSDLCLSCHQRELPRATASSPHDLPAETLATLTLKAAYRSGASTESCLQRLVSIRRSPDSLMVSQSAQEGYAEHSPLDPSSPLPTSPTVTRTPRFPQTECSQCHREHQGANASLAEITSQRCQACHVQRFESFGDGHPEFTSYPSRSPARIAFDHSKHQQEYFSKKQANFDCKECHLRSDERGPVGNIFRSVSFERACSKCHEAGLNTALEDGIAWIQLPSFHVEKWREASVEIGAWPASASSIDDGTLHPWTRILLAGDPEFADILRDWPSSLRISDLKVDNAEDRARVAAIAHAYRRLIDSLAKGGQKALSERLVSGLASYRSGHNIPETAMAAWIDEVVAHIPPDLFRLAGREWFGSETRSDAKLGGVYPKVRSATLTSARGTPVDLVREPPSDPDADDLLSGDSLLTTTGTNPGENGDINSTSQEPNPLSARNRLASGGWLLDNERLAIVYVPTGHADPWISRWIELEGVHDAVAQASTGHSSRRTDLRQQCLQCHLQPKPFLDASNLSLEGDQKHNMAWRSVPHAVGNRPFTRFNHSPHLAIPALGDCKSCHRMSSNPSKESNGVRYIDTPQRNELVAPSFTASHFEAMSKDACADCHHRKAAGDQCTKCHHYHVHASEHALLGDIQRGLAELK